MTFAARLCCCLAAAALPGAVAAQDDWTGTRLPGHKPGDVVAAGESPAVPARTVGSDAEQTGRHMAACVVSRDRGAAMAYALSDNDPTAPSSYGAVSRLLPSCLNQQGRALQVSQLRFKTTTLKGLLAEAALVSGPVVPLPVLPERADYAASWTGQDAGERAVDEMGLCLAERAPDQAAAVIWSKPGSAEEGAAFAAIKPMIGPCLVANATLKTNLFGVRLSLAKAYLHRSRAAPTATLTAK